MGHQDAVEGPAGPPRRVQGPYIAPPHIRTTGELPAVTGEIPASQLPDPHDPGADRPEAEERWPDGGSVVDRPPPSPPDWMSGVQVPELLVTMEVDRGRLGQHGGGFVATAKRVIGLVLVAVLVAVVVLVLARSVSGF